MSGKTNQLAPIIMRVILLVALLAVAGVWLIASSARDTSDIEYFPQTGHNIKGDFLAFFRARGGLELFGYPITEELVENGRRVQYFQRARMDAYPENPTGSRVQLAPLAELMGKATQPIDPSQRPASGDPNQRYYPETGHSVSFNFLSFFDARGGVDVFGYPITEFFNEGGRFVQYFQRARLEYYPDLPAAQQVQIAYLGEIYFEWAKLDPYVKRPVASARLSDSAGSFNLQLEASVATPYVSYPGQQTLHVYVSDQAGQDVQSAEVQFTVNFPAGPKTYSMPATDSNGYSTSTFDLEDAPVGQTVVIHVTARLGSASGVRETSFTYWR